MMGPAGVGKSEILRSVTGEWAKSGAPTLRVAGSQFDQHVPLGGVMQLLDGAANTGHRSDGHERSSDNVELTAATDLIAALDRCATQNTLVVVDDAHWLDETSRRVIEFALRRLDDRAPATLVAQRHGVPMIPFGERITVGGLSRQELNGLLDARIDRVVTDNERATAWEHTAGNPLAAIEWASRGPSTKLVDVEATIGDRLASCSVRERQALCMLARHRRGDSIDDAWATIDGATDLIDTLRTGTGSDLLEPEAPLRFRHPEYQAAAATCIDSADRAAIARALASTTSIDDNAAWHLADATQNPDDAVARQLAAVAQRSIELGAPIEAARANERAAQLAVSPTLAADQLIAAGEAWWYACFPEETARVTAGRWMTDIDVPRQIRLRQLHRAAVGWKHHVLETVRGYLDDADVAQQVNADLAAGLRTSAFVEACLAGRADLAADITTALESGCATAASASPTWAGVLSVCRGFTHVLQGNVTQKGEPADRANATPARADLGVMDLFATLEPYKLDTSALNLLQLVGYADMVLDRRDAATRTLSGLRTEAHCRGAVAITDFTDACLAELERRSGRWASALSRTMSDLAIDPSRTSAGKAWQRAIRARILAAQGRLTDDSLVDSVVDEAGPVGMEFIVAVARSAQATDRIARGDWEEASTLLDEVRRVAQHGDTEEAGLLWYELDHIESLWKTARTDDLRRVVEQLQRHAERTNRPWSRALVDLGSVLLGRTERLTDDDSRHDLGAPFESARIELLLAEHAQASNTDVPDISEVRQVFARLGATPFTARCDALGSDPSPKALAGIYETLTPAELRVAVAVAAGRTNAEAATELFLSVRTVEAHLRSIFRKLDVRNRVELAAIVVGAQDIEPMTPQR